MICFDTHVVIWGLRRECEPGQEAMVERAGRYIDALVTAAKPEHVAVPAPVFQEFLLGSRSRELRASEGAVLEGAFPILPLDAPAAALAAELESRAAEAARGARSADDTVGAPGARARYRMDAQILAIAIVRGAHTIVSHDPHMRALAVGERIRVIELPDSPWQPSLFEAE